MNSISGQGWARAGLAFGAALSVLGNVAHTVLNPSAVSLWLRVPFAVVWPVALFFGIEVLVRVDWRRKFIDHAGRVLLWLPVSIVAAFVSWLHLHRLMVMAGEETLAAIAGPFAIDGLMIGCTVALLAIRAARLAPTMELSAVNVSTPDTDVVVTTETGAPFPVSEEFAKRERAPRATSEAQEKAARLVAEGQSAQDAADAAGVPLSTARRYQTVARKLAADPSTDLGKVPGVSPALISIIRDTVAREGRKP